MKTLIYGLFIFSLSAFSLEKGAVKLSKLKEIETDWQIMNSYDVDEMFQHQRKNTIKESLRLLRLSKEYIIKGEVKKAKYLLKKINTDKTSLTPIVLRYKAIIALIENDFTKVKNLLSKDTFKDPKYNREVCLMNIIARVPDGPTEELSKIFTTCQNHTLKYSPTEHFWLETLKLLIFNKQALLEGNKISDFQWILRNKDFVRVWLKTGIYINREKLVEKDLGTLPPRFYRSKVIRELIALIYYRIGEIDKAKEFIEDIQGPNADNMRGNINLTEKKYELAYGHFKLALQKKENSRNAIERAIPLSWMLEQWKEGIDLLTKSINPKLDTRKKLALNTAFKLRDKNIEAANDQILVLKELYRKKLPFELELINSYVGLLKGERERYTNAYELTCRRHDGLSCWVQMQTLIWRDLSKLAKRKEALPTDKAEKEIDKLKSLIEYKPLKEVISIDQRDIEELDGELLSL